VLVPVAAFGHVVVLPHDSIGAPGNEVGDPDVDTEVAARAGVHLDCFSSTDGLDNVGVAALGLGPAKPGFQAIDIQRLWVFTFTTAWSITPRHESAQYQFFCCEWPHALQGVPYRASM
jgi:hypothetical protein